MKPQFEIYSRKPLIGRRQYRWRLRARNGKIIAASSEGFNNRQDCLDNAYNVRQTFNQQPNKLEQ